MLTQAEVVVSKPRLTYQQFVAQQQPEATVAWVIEKFIAEMNGTADRPAVKELGESHECTLRVTQRAPIAKVLWRKLDQDHVIDFMRELQAGGAKPQTCGQYYTYLSGALKYAGAAFKDCKGLTDKALKAAQPFLTKHGLIGKSEPRRRLPEPHEIAAIEAEAARANRHRNNKIDMVRFSRWQLASSRRLSESCRITWIDWDCETQTILVHKMKDPKNRNKTKRVALTDEAQAMLLEMAWEMNDKPETWANTEPRIFPYVAKSAGQKYTKLKKRAGVVGLHLHDSRAGCYTSMRERGVPAAVAILVTGHEAEALPERVYKRMKAESFKSLQHLREAA